MTTTVQTELPDQINVSRHITYDVERLIEDLIDQGYTREEITLKTLMDYIQDWVIDDFGTESGVIYQDETGKEL